MLSPIALPETLPHDWRLDEDSVLSFCLADTDDRCDRLLVGDPTARIARRERRQRPPSDRPERRRRERHRPDDRAGRVRRMRRRRLPLSHVSPLQPALHVTFTKWTYWERSRDKSAVEPVLQTYEIPLADFVAGQSRLSPRSELTGNPIPFRPHDVPRPSPGPRGIRVAARSGPAESPAQPSGTK